MLNPFTAKPGELIKGLGLDFASRLAQGETVQSVVITPVDGLTVNATSQAGTFAMADVTIAENQAESELVLLYTATGTLGSVRKGYRTILVRKVSN